MEASQPEAVTADAIYAPPPSADLVGGHGAPVAVEGCTAPPRNRHGNVVVQGGAPTGPAVKARPPRRLRREFGPATAGEEGEGSRCETQEARGESCPAKTSPDCSGKSFPEHSRRWRCCRPEVFDRMRASAGIHHATADFVQILDVDIDQTPISEYGYNEMEGGVHGHGEEDDVEEVDEGVYDEAQAKRARSKNYTPLEDRILIKAWESVSLDACTGTDQTAKRYWQRIEDQFFHMMAKYPNRTPRTFRSLQGRWDVIKPICSRWAACLQQVHNAPPSGTVEADYEKIVQERYKDMEASGKNAFQLEHCWELLKESEKWKLIDKESPPKRGALTKIDDDDDEDGPRNKNKPDGNKKAKDKIKKEAEASSLRDKLDHMVKSNEVLVIKTLEEKKKLAEKKAQEKQEKWQLLKEETDRKAAPLRREEPWPTRTKPWPSFSPRRTRS